MPTIHKTRFTELGYWKVEDGCWSVVDLSDLSRPAQVGQKYPTKEALLGNLENYAFQFGCELAVANPRLAKLEAFYREVAELTLNHANIGDCAVVFPSVLGLALEKVDPEWWKQ